MPTNLDRPASFLAGETDDPEDTSTLRDIQREKHHVRLPGRRRTGSFMQFLGAVLLVGGSWDLGGPGVGAIVAAAVLVPVGVLVEMGRI